MLLVLLSLSMFCCEIARAEDYAVFHLSQGEKLIIIEQDKQQVAILVSKDVPFKGVDKEQISFKNVAIMRPRPATLTRVTPRLVDSISSSKNPAAAKLLKELNIQNLQATYKELEILFNDEK